MLRSKCRGSALRLRKPHWALHDRLSPPRGLRLHRLDNLDNRRRRRGDAPGAAGRLHCRCAGSCAGDHDDDADRRQRPGARVLARYRMAHRSMGTAGWSDRRHARRNAFFDHARRMAPGNRRPVPGVDHRAVSVRCEGEDVRGPHVVVPTGGIACWFPLRPDRHDGAGDEQPLPQCRGRKGTHGRHQDRGVAADASRAGRHLHGLRRDDR